MPFQHSIEAQISSLKPRTFADQLRRTDRKAVASVLLLGVLALASCTSPSQPTETPNLHDKGGISLRCSDALTSTKKLFENLQPGDYFWMDKGAGIINNSEGGVRVTYNPNTEGILTVNTSFSHADIVNITPYFSDLSRSFIIDRYINRLEIDKDLKYPKKTYIASLLSSPAFSTTILAGIYCAK